MWGLIKSGTFIVAFLWPAEASAANLFNRKEDETTNITYSQVPHL